MTVPWPAVYYLLMMCYSCVLILSENIAMHYCSPPFFSSLKATTGGFHESPESNFFIQLLHTTIMSTTTVMSVQRSSSWLRGNAISEAPFVQPARPLQDAPRHNLAPSNNTWTARTSEAPSPDPIHHGRVEIAPPEVGAEPPDCHLMRTEGVVCMMDNSEVACAAIRDSQVSSRSSLLCGVLERSNLQRPPEYLGVLARDIGCIQVTGMMISRSVLLSKEPNGGFCIWSYVKDDCLQFLQTLGFVFEMRSKAAGAHGWVTYKQGSQDVWLCCKSIPCHFDCEDGAVPRVVLSLSLQFDPISSDASVGTCMWVNKDSEFHRRDELSVSGTLSIYDVSLQSVQSYSSVTSPSVPWIQHAVDTGVLTKHNLSFRLEDVNPAHVLLTETDIQLAVDAGTADSEITLSTASLACPSLYEPRPMKKLGIAGGGGQLAPLSTTLRLCTELTWWRVATLNASVRQRVYDAISSGADVFALMKKFPVACSHRVYFSPVEFEISTLGTWKQLLQHCRGMLHQSPLLAATSTPNIVGDSTKGGKRSRSPSTPMDGNVSTVGARKEEDLHSPLSPGCEIEYDALLLAIQNEDLESAHSILSHHALMKGLEDETLADVAVHTIMIVGVKPNHHFVYAHYVDGRIDATESLQTSVSTAVHLKELAGCMERVFKRRVTYTVGYGELQDANGCAYYSLNNLLAACGSSARYTRQSLVQMYNASLGACVPPPK